MQLENKTILITGANSGVGFSLLTALYPHNDIIVITRNDERSKLLLKEFPKITTYLADLSYIDQVRQVCRLIALNHKNIDILFNNAAIQFEPHFTSSTFCPKSIETEITTNLTTVCYLTYTVLSTMQVKGTGAIVNINSALAFVPKANSAVYSASKAGMNLFTQTLRNQLTCTGIEVHQAFLPLVDTPMTVNRQSKKSSPKSIAKAIIKGVEQRVYDNYIGKVKLLRIINWLLPSVAKKIMRGQ